MIYITRFADYGYPDEGTFGILTFGDFRCYTVERPWADNQPWVSCIPVGEYSLEMHDSPKFGMTPIIYGNTVSKYPSSIHARSSILIHPANVSNELSGCIGLGDSMGVMNDKHAVFNSRNTVNFFKNLLNNMETYTVIIQWRATQ